MLSAAPLAFRVGPRGFVALFCFGVAVLVGLSPIEEDDVLAKIKARITGERDRIDDETAVLEIAAEHDDRIPPGGPVLLKDLSPQRFLVVADALAKIVSLGRDERAVSAVFDVIEPFAQKFAMTSSLRLSAPARSFSSYSSSRRPWRRSRSGRSHRTSGFSSALGRSA